MRRFKIALVRGKFLNRFEMQSFEPLVRRFDLTAFGSLTPFHDRFSFPVVTLPSPTDLPDFPYKMPVLNRLFIDAHYLLGLEGRLKNFDLAHTAETYYHYTQQALDAKKLGHVKKVIATVWETIPFNNEGIWGRRMFKKRAIQELDHIIAVTGKAKDALINEGADPQKITVIAPGVDTKRFYPAPLRKNVQTILFVGRPEPEKGVDEIRSVIPFLPKDLTWRFVHNEPYESMPEVYRTADIFVAPSKVTPTWEEQYGMALLEAQASGLPIVTTRTGGIPENVGDAAVLIPPGDVGALAKAVNAFLRSPTKRAMYAKRARKRAVTVHDIAIGARKLAALYERVLQ